jgi:hypothetical protein
MAQEFDAHNQWLFHQLQRQDILEKKLYRQLRGDEPSFDRATGTIQSWENEDSFQYMVLDRLKAWSRVMLSHGSIQGPLVTTAASVLTLIQEHVEDNETLILVATVPAAQMDTTTAEDEQRGLMDYCEKLMHTPVSLLRDSGLLDTYPEETMDPLSMKLYLLPDIAPRSLLTRFVEGSHPGNRDAAVEVNTLIACIEPEPK